MMRMSAPVNEASKAAVNWHLGRGSRVQGRPLWVPETLHRSRDLLILVEQSTEPVAPLDGVRLACRPLGEWS